MKKKIHNITLVGTSHISKDSITLIKETVNEENPEVICLELDLNRFNNLLSERTTTFKEKLGLLRKVGVFGTLFYLISHYFQQKIAKKVKMKPGVDMLTGYNLAREKKVPISLIDLPIENTMKKISKIPFIKKIGLALKLLFSGFKKENKELLNFDFKKIPKDELISKIILLLKKEVPILYKILIQDRNHYMSRKLLELARNHEGNIIAVVGAAHVEGMEKILTKKLEEENNSENTKSFILQ